MPVFNTLLLLSDLRAEIESQIARAKELQSLSPENLLQIPASGGWSIAQVIEHLNTYNAYYNPEIRAGLARSNNAFDPVFPSGILGNYFTNSMLPKSGKVKNKMKAFKNHSPAPNLNVIGVINDFIDHQTELLRLIEAAKKTDLGKIRIPISISRLIKLKLGDTLRFLIAHQQRHFVQIDNITVSLH